MSLEMWQSLSIRQFNIQYTKLQTASRPACDDDCVRSARGRLLDTCVGKLCYDARQQLRRIVAVNKPAEVARSEGAGKPTQALLGHQAGDVLPKCLSMRRVPDDCNNTRQDNQLV